MDGLVSVSKTQILKSLETFDRMLEEIEGDVEVLAQQMKNNLQRKFFIFKTTEWDRFSKASWFSFGLHDYLLHHKRITQKDFDVLDWEYSSKGIIVNSLRSLVSVNGRHISDVFLTPKQADFVAEFQ